MGGYRKSMKSDLAGKFRSKDFFQQYNELPGRIFIDSNVLQYLQDFGEYIFEHYRESGDYFLDPKGGKIGKESRIYREIIALEQIFQGIERANFEFAVSEAVYKEVLNKKDRRYLQWFFDVLDHWQSVLESYKGDPFSGSGKKLAEKARNDTSLINGLSREDQQILFDALELECDAILTCDRYRDRQDRIYEHYRIMVLYPSDFVEILKPFQSLYL